VGFLREIYEELLELWIKGTEEKEKENRAADKTPAESLRSLVRGSLPCPKQQ